MSGRWYFLLMTFSLSSAAYLGLHEGETCREEGNKQWHCKILPECTKLKDLRNNEHDICGFNGTTPFVCCPPTSTETTLPVKLGSVPLASHATRHRPSWMANNTKDSVHMNKSTPSSATVSTTSTTTGKTPTSTDGVVENSTPTTTKNTLAATREKFKGTTEVNQTNSTVSVTSSHSQVSDKKVADDVDTPMLKGCLKFNECKPRQVGNIDTSFVNGDDSHPHMALIGYGPKEDKSWGCAGSLVSEKHVLSVAHCTSSQHHGPAQWVRLGELGISTPPGVATAQDFKIIRRINHPEYKQPSPYNDIAVYELDREATITDWVKPICLHTQKSITEHYGTITGWWRMDPYSHASGDYLKVFPTNIMSDEDCLEAYKDQSTTLIPKGVNVTTMICSIPTPGSKDICAKVSGGPVAVIDRHCRHKVLAGVTSLGPKCGSKPSPVIHTRIGPYTEWIESIIWANDEI